MCEKCPNSAIAWRGAAGPLWKVQCYTEVIISEIPNFSIAVAKLGPLREEVIGVVC